jgi:DNA-directed RNA polymerase sigma subunit (sigma70/sigma32)
MDARRRLQTAVRRVSTAEEGLASARAELRAAMIGAHQEGLTLSEIGRIVGVTRQRVRQVIESVTPDGP